MRKLLSTTLLSVCLLAMFGCQSPQKPIETVVYDQASGFTLITDTVKLDLGKIIVPQTDTETGNEFEHCITTKFRGEYKLALYLYSNSFDTKMILTTLSSNLEPRYDIQTFEIDDYTTSDLHVEHDSLVIPICYDESDYPRKFHLLNLESGSTQPFSYYSMPCYEDDSVRMDFADIGEFGKYQTFYSKNNNNKRCVAMPINRLLRWHGSYYSIASYDIYRVDNPLAVQPTWALKNEASRIEQDSACFVSPISALSLSNSMSSNSYYGDCEYDTVYHTAFIHDDKLFVVESRPKDGLYLMQIEEPGSKHEVLRICDFLPIWENLNTKFVSLYPDSYSILQTIGYNADGKHIEHRGFIEFSNDTIRTVVLQLE